MWQHTSSLNSGLLGLNKGLPWKGSSNVLIHSSTSSVNFMLSVTLLGWWPVSPLATAPNDELSLELILTHSHRKAVFRGYSRPVESLTIKLQRQRWHNICTPASAVTEYTKLWKHFMDGSTCHNMETPKRFPHKSKVPLSSGSISSFLALPGFLFGMLRFIDCSCALPKIKSQNSDLVQSHKTIQWWLKCDAHPFEIASEVHDW